MGASKQAILNYKWNNETERAENIRLERMFIIANGCGAKFGKDGDQFYYVSGNLPEPDCIVGFGNTPLQALEEFCKSFESNQT